MREAKGPDTGADDKLKAESKGEEGAAAKSEEVELQVQEEDSNLNTSFTEVAIKVTVKQGNPTSECVEGMESAEKRGRFVSSCFAALMSLEIGPLMRISQSMNVQPEQLKRSFYCRCRRWTPSPSCSMGGRAALTLICAVVPDFVNCIKTAVCNVVSWLLLPFRSKWKMLPSSYFACQIQNLASNFLTTSFPLIVSFPENASFQTPCSHHQSKTMKTLNKS